MMVLYAEIFDIVPSLWVKQAQTWASERNKKNEHDVH